MLPSTTSITASVTLTHFSRSHRGHQWQIVFFGATFCYHETCTQTCNVMHWCILPGTNTIYCTSELGLFFKVTEVINAKLVFGATFHYSETYRLAISDIGVSLQVLTPCPASVTSAYFSRSQSSSMTNWFSVLLGNGLDQHATFTFSIMNRYVYMYM